MNQSEENFSLVEDEKEILFFFPWPLPVSKTDVKRVQTHKKNEHKQIWAATRQPQLEEEQTLPVWAPKRGLFLSADPMIKLLSGNKQSPAAPFSPTTE